LTSSIPNLKLNYGAVDLDGSDFEVDTDSADERFGEGVVCKAQQQAALTNTTVTNQQKLEEVVTK
jgi:hypothetical protein